MTVRAFLVPGVPVAKGRPRFTRAGAHVRTYTPESTARYEDRVRNAACLAGIKVTDGPFRVEIEAVWPTRGAPRKRDPRASEPKATKPDADNLAKTVLDALNGYAWHDDAQVVDLRVTKRHAAQDEAAHVRVSIESL